MGKKNLFLCLTLSHMSSVPHSVEKREKKAFYAGYLQKKINPTVSILARELTIFFHYKLKLKSQPFSVFDQVFLTFQHVSTITEVNTIHLPLYILTMINCLLFLVFSHCKQKGWRILVQFYCQVVNLLAWFLPKVASQFCILLCHLDHSLFQSKVKKEKIIKCVSGLLLFIHQFLPKLTCHFLTVTLHVATNSTQYFWEFLSEGE